MVSTILPSVPFCEAGHNSYLIPYSSLLHFLRGKKTVGAASLDVKAIIPRSTHPVTVKLTCGERYDTHCLQSTSRGARCTKYKYDTLQDMAHCKIWHTAHRTLFGLALGLAAKDMTPSAHSEACNQLLTVFHISYHLICSKTTFYDHPGKTVGGREVVKWSCSRPNTFPSLCIVLVWIHLHEKHPHTKPTVQY